MWVVYYRVFTRVWKNGHERQRKQLVLAESAVIDVIERQRKMRHSSTQMEIVIIGAYPTKARALDKYNTLRRVRAEREKRAGLSSP